MQHADSQELTDSAPLDMHLLLLWIPLVLPAYLEAPHSTGQPVAHANAFSELLCILCITMHTEVSMLHLEEHVVLCKANMCPV